MLQVPLSPDTEARLREQARARGEDVSLYAAGLLKKALSAPSIEELLGPFRKQVAESGISDEELDSLGESLRDEVWHDRQGKEANGA